MSLLSIQNLNFSYDLSKPPILTNVNWDIAEHDRWVLFGHNGSGKSTLLEIITGYKRASSGKILRFGQSEIGSDIRQLRRKIGYLSSLMRSRVFTHERAIDLVESGYFATAGLYDEAPAWLRERAFYMLESVGLAKRSNDLFSHFSEGERQKLMMARALVHKPALLILDEATAGLDIRSREELLRSLESLVENEKSALIYVTHHVEEIIPLFDKTLLLKNGSVLASGETANLIESKLLSQMFEIPLTIETHNDRFYSRLMP